MAARLPVGVEPADPHHQLAGLALDVAAGVPGRHLPVEGVAADVDDHLVPGVLDKESIFTAAFERRTGEVAPYWAGLGRALEQGTPDAVREWLDRAMGWWDASATFQRVIRESLAIDLRFAMARRTALADLAATLELARFPAERHDRVRQKIVLLMLQLDVAWYQWHVNGTYAIDRDELLDTLCALWCSTLGFPVRG